MLKIFEYTEEGIPAASENCRSSSTIVSQSFRLASLSKGDNSQGSGSWWRPMIIAFRTRIPDSTHNSDGVARSACRANNNRVRVCNVGKLTCALPCKPSSQAFIIEQFLVIWSSEIRSVVEPRSLESLRRDAAETTARIWGMTQLLT